MFRSTRLATLAAPVALLWVGLAAPLAAQSTPVPVPAPAASPASATPLAPGEPSYADLVTLADAAEVVVRAQVRRQKRIDEAGTRGLAPGHARLLVEARTLALLSGTAPLGEALRYLVDVPLDAKGRAPKLRRQEVLLFARTVPGQPGQLQLVGPRAQLAFSPALEPRVRAVLTALAAADAPPVVTGVADVLSVAGTLAGETETQLFLSTASGAPASLTVLRRPGEPVRWGVSWSELIDQAAAAPAPDTLGWQRLACGLPAVLPAGTSLAADPEARARAEADYAFVREALGSCTRVLTGSGSGRG